MKPLSHLVCISSITPETPVAPHEKFTVDACGGGDKGHTIIFSNEICHKLIKNHQYET